MIRVGWVWTNDLGFDGAASDLVCGPYSFAQAITPSDVVDFVGLGPSRPYCDAIHVGGRGIVPVVWPDGAVTPMSCVTGQVLQVRAKRVNATGCTASPLVALYHG